MTTPSNTGWSDTTEPDVMYHVVLNDEEQYSIWPVDRELPSGWRTEGTTGTKDDCLAHIDVVWTDMRPLSLRRFMAEHADTPAEALPAEPEGPSLTDRLCTGDHPVEASLRPERSAAELRTAVERGYVFVRFTDTRGGTELGVELDRSACVLDGGDFTESNGRITLVGDLVLDWEPVRCIAEIDLATLTGTGRLERV